MIQISYPLAEGEEPNEELEDSIDHLMGDSDFQMCGSGGISGEVRELEFEGDDEEHEGEFKGLIRLHQELLDLDPRITWEVFGEDD